MTSEPSVGLAAPVSQTERIDEIDALRGVALLGVLIANFVGFAGSGLMATEAQLDALATAQFDKVADFLVSWLVANKANTLFATLFGLGFYIQISRNADRPGFVKRYSRRLFWLLVFGILNMTLLWVWDILNLYAIAGFLLLAVRKWRTRTMVIAGFALAMISSSAVGAVADSLGYELMAWNPYGDAAVLERQAASAAGDYPALVSLFWKYTWVEWLAGGMIFMWIAYSGGRFLLGAAIGRSGIAGNVEENLPLIRKVRNWTLPLGLIFSALVVYLEGDGSAFGETGKQVAPFLWSPSALLLAAAYAATVAAGWHNRTGHAVLVHFRPVGQMALTNYLMQGFAYAFVLFGVGPGLNLGGRIGTAAVLVICFAFFAFQIAFSRWWLARFRFGPMEWLWRWLTYGGSAPAIRRTAPA